MKWQLRASHHVLKALFGRSLECIPANGLLGVFFGLFLGVVLSRSAAAQNEVAWQLSGTPDRPLNRFASPLISDGFALVGVGAGVGVYDIESGELLHDVVLPAPKPVERSSFAASSGRLLISDTVWAPNGIRGHSRAFVFDIASGETISQLQLPTPTLRLGMGASVAIHDELGLVSSLSCLDTCFDEDRFTVRGVVDVFDVGTGDHLYEIVSPDNSVFAQGLVVGDGVIAVSSRSRSLETAGRVSLYSATDGQLLTTLHPEVDGALGHSFGFDLDIYDNLLVVGDNPDLRGHGMFGNGQGNVAIYDLTTHEQVAHFSASDLKLEGTPRFGTSVGISHGRVVVGAPSAGSNLAVAPPASVDGLDSGACAESFTSGGPCFEPLPTVRREGQATGQVQIIDVATGGSLTRTGWTGGDAVALNEAFALVQSNTEDGTSVYAISLAGLVPREENLENNLSSLGDIDEDGYIQFSDFLILSTNFGRDLFGAENGDLDESGIVDFIDFLILSSNYDTPPVAVSVPEPNFCLNLPMLLCCFLLLRRREGRK